LIRREGPLSYWEVANALRGIDTTFFGDLADANVRMIWDILIDENSFLFSDEGRNIILMLHRSSLKTAKLHIYVAPGFRGKAAVLFIRKVWDEVRKTDIKYVFNITKDPKVKMFMGCFEGSKRVGIKEGYTIYRTEV